jgi:hypothetical protein
METRCVFCEIETDLRILFILAEMPGVARVEISKPAIVGRLEVSPAINSRPDRITPGTHWIGGSNDENGVYPTTQFRL